jgi:predicted 3-demethylubiquinone-9 3-methyltransferase (glyoxalase superfamily)
MPKITPFLWFDTQAEAAANFYVSLFPNSRILNVSRYPDGAPNAGAAMTVTFELDGQVVTALNGGTEYKLNEAFSFYVDCEDQAEVDTLWAKLTAEGGEEGPCGWCKDRFGLSWQIIPKALTELVSDPDPAKAGSVMQAMFKMKKIDTALLQQAYDRVKV